MEGLKIYVAGQGISNGAEQWCPVQRSGCKSEVPCNIVEVSR